MKKTIAIIITLVMATGVGFSQKIKTKAKKQDVVEFTLNEDICQGCKRKIDNNIAFEKGVTNIYYGEDGSTVQITFLPDRTDTLKLRQAFEKVKLEVVKTRLLTQEDKKK